VITPLRRSQGISQLYLHTCVKVSVSKAICQNYWGHFGSKKEHSLHTLENVDGKNEQVMSSGQSLVVSFQSRRRNFGISPEVFRSDTERTDVEAETDEILLDHLAVYSTQYSTVAHCRARAWMLVLVFYWLFYVVDC